MELNSNVNLFSQNRLLTLNDIIGNKAQGKSGLVPLERAAWTKGVKAGRFPQPIDVGTSKMMWKSSDIEAFINGVYVPVKGVCNGR